MEHPDEITGHGLHVLRGGFRSRDDVFARGVEIWRGSELLHEGPRPAAETGDWYADWVSREQALVALILSYAQPTAHPGRQGPGRRA